MEFLLLFIALSKDFSSEDVQLSILIKNGLGGTHRE